MREYSTSSVPEYRPSTSHWQLSAHISPEKFEEILPKWTGYPAIIPGYISPKMTQKLVYINRQLDQFIGLNAGIWGSNSWVVAPERTVNKKAWLANDPHLGLQLPSIWIEMHLKAVGFEVMGFSLPGAPGIIIGRNNSIAWGLTNVMIDDSDFFLEKVDTLKGIYWKDNASLPLQKRDHLIKIKDQASTAVPISTRCAPSSTTGSPTTIRTPAGT